jgi:hypothetical protein
VPEILNFATSVAGAAIAPTRSIKSIRRTEGHYRRRFPTECLVCHSGDSRESRLKTLPTFHDGHDMMDSFGLPVIRPGSMSSAEITSYKPTRQEAFPTTPFPADFGVADHSYSRV